MDRAAWQALVHRVAQNQTQLKWLSMHAHCGSHNAKGFVRENMFHPQQDPVG